jgi:hypothetical protein
MVNSQRALKNLRGIMILTSGNGIVIVESEAPELGLGVR